MDPGSIINAVNAVVLGIGIVAGSYLGARMAVKPWIKIRLEEKKHEEQKTERRPYEEEREYREQREERREIRAPRPPERPTYREEIRPRKTYEQVRNRNDQAVVEALEVYSGDETAPDKRGPVRDREDTSWKGGSDEEP